MKKPLSDKEILVNTICNNMREIITKNHESYEADLAGLIIGHLTEYEKAVDLATLLVIVKFWLVEIQDENGYSYENHIATVTLRAITKYEETNGN